MKYLEEPCTRCYKNTVVPPQKNELNKSRILVVCTSCGKCSRYNIRHRKDRSLGYWLSKWGRDKVPDKLRKKPATISWSDDQESRTQAAGETRQTLLAFAYRVRVLMLDK